MSEHQESLSRRRFLKTGSVLAAGAVVAARGVPRVHAAGDEMIQIALVGSGGRGCGAAINALATAGQTKLVAIADVFPDRVAGAVGALTNHFNDSQQPGKLDVPPERQFTGFDAYRRALDVLRPGDVAIFATAPVFRPLHVEYAVSKGLHVFMEKPFATDSPGTRRIQAASRLADEKNLKVACGLMWRHCRAREAFVERVRDGAIGELVHLRGFRTHGPYGRGRLPNEGELEYQIRAFHLFNWAGGDLFIDYCIHNIDVACWVKGAWPVRCIGYGGRNVPMLPGQLYDHYYQEFEFADGTHLSSHGQYRNGCFHQYRDLVHGTKGCGVLMDSLGAAKSRLFSGTSMTDTALLWRYDKPEENPYQIEHDLFFDAIRCNKPYNEGHRAAEAQFASLLGRAAMNSGQQVTWDQIVASQVKYCDVDNLSFDTPPWIVTDDQGRYPIPVPGENVEAVF